ncbi:MAG: enoyl-CoA hydratase-related protein [Bacteroidota bacterium]
MGKYKHLSFDLSDQIQTITLNRPNALNALNIELVNELKQAFEEAANNHEVGSILLTGSGEKAFAAGADITEIANLNDVNARSFSENGQEVFAIIENFEKPVVAAINGYALGGGCELAMACHFRVASATAMFGQPEVNLGLIPGYGGTQRLTKLIGKGRALELMMTGNSIDANEAYRIGLVNHLEETQEDMIALARKLLQKIMSKAPIAISMVIASANAADKSGENGYLTEANAFASCCNTEDFKEGTAAFLEKRKPDFSGK